MVKKTIIAKQIKRSDTPRKEVVCLNDSSDIKDKVRKAVVTWRSSVRITRSGKLKATEI